MRGGVCEDACASVIGLSIQECGLGSGDQVHTHSHAGECVHTAGARPAQAWGRCRLLSSLVWTPTPALDPAEARDVRGHLKSQLSR